MNNKLLVFFVLLAIAPIWVFEFVPSVDYPKHLFIAYAIKNIGNGFENFFELNPFGVPNSLGYALIIALNFFLPILAAGKVFLSILIALFIFGMKYFFDSLNRESGWLPFAGISFVFSASFIIGFFNFLLGLSISFFAMGYWIRNIEKSGLKEKAVLSALLLLVYLSHFMAFFFLFFITAVASFFYFKKPKEAISAISPFALGFAVFAAFCFAPSATAIDFQPVVWTAFGKKFSDFLYLLKSVQNDLGSIAPVLIFFALCTAACARFLEKKGKKLHFRKNINSALFASVVAGLLLFLLLPIKAGTYSPISSRLPVFLFFVIVAIIGEPKKQPFRKAFVLLVLLAAMLSIANAFLFFSEEQQEIKDYVSAIDLVAENSRLLPLNTFRSRSFPKFPISLHAYSYYLIEKGGVAPYFYLTKMFPLNYKDKSFEAAPPEWTTRFYSDAEHAEYFDYVLTYGNRSGYEQELEKSFEKIFEKGLFALYKKKGGA